MAHETEPAETVLGPVRGLFSVLAIYAVLGALAYALRALGVL